MIKYKIDPIPNIIKKINKEIFPLTLRCLIVGTSGCGKKKLALQVGKEVALHPDNKHLRLNLSLHSTAQHAVQCKMAVWQQHPR